jgi:hypothetical protein
VRVLILFLLVLLLFVPVILLRMVVFSIINKEHVLLTIPDGVVEDLGLKVGLLLVVSPDSLFLVKVG